MNNLPHSEYWTPTTSCEQNFSVLCMNKIMYTKTAVTMALATILESDVVIRFEVFELQQLKVDQLFGRFFRDFPMFIKLKYIQK